MAVAKNKKTTFDAGQFGTLKYDFSAFDGPSGIVPDPSDEKLQAFSDGYTELLEKYEVDGKEVDTSDPDAVADAIERNKNFSIVDQQKEMAHLICELIDQSPSEEAVLALPFRIRQSFIAWVQRELVNPEA